MGTTLTYNNSTTSREAYWPLTSSTDPLDDDRNELLKALLSHHVLSFLIPYAIHPSYPINPIEIDVSSVSPEFRTRNETFIFEEIDSKLLGEESVENSILEAMIENEGDIILPPKNIYRISLKLNVEKNKGPYHIS
jgi:hypothetical protein